MKTILGWASGALMLTGLAATGADAMPIAPHEMLGDGGITMVRDGCGPFGHRSHYGFCKPNGYGVYGGPAALFRSTALLPAAAAALRRALHLLRPAPLLPVVSRADPT